MSLPKNSMTVQLPIGLLKINPEFDSSIPNKDDDSALAKDMKQKGMLTPLLVNEKLEIVGGHRRYRAAMMLGWTTLMCDVENYEKVLRKLEKDS